MVIYSPFRAAPLSDTELVAKRFYRQIEPNKYADIVTSLNEKKSHFCWRKAQLIDTEAQIDFPNEMKNIHIT